MKKTFTIILSIFSVLAFSQPEITQSNIPHVGDHVVIAICSDLVNPGTSGTNQTWDMSGLTETEEQSFTYILPSAGIEPDSFPNATLCGVSWQDDYSNYSVSPSSLSVEGYAVTISPDDTSLIVYDDPEQIIQLPFTYNDTFLDNFSGVSYIPGFGAFPFDGYLDFEADGYGTLILPTGTYNNVVRYHFYREQTNYVGGFPAGTTTKDQWAWVSSDYRFWLLLMEEVFDGISTTPLVWYDKNPYSASTSVNTLNYRSTTVYPNPLRVGQQINITWDRHEQAYVSLVSMDGSVMDKKQTELSEGSNSIVFNHIIPGLYVIKIETNGSFSTQKISVIN
ncbi:MAG: T9SS type A sorting domain-containing protein [Bacteroidales bacterium]|nr:T9SS type A sorting domain-containing protein [Bacteroidales bacterium]MCF8404384.1 T9SS type A sorting domain-containing protein [Bacteroidales bacterium]